MFQSNDTYAQFFMKLIIGIFLIEAISGDQKVSKVPILCESSSDCTGNFLIPQYFLRVEETFFGILPQCTVK